MANNSDEQAVVNNSDSRESSDEIDEIDVNSNGNVQEDLPANAPGAQGQTQQQGFNGWAVFKTLLFRMVIIYLISQWFRKSNTPTTKTSDGQVQGPIPASNIFGKDTYMDLYVYITEEETMTKFDESSLFWMEESMPYDSWAGGHDGEGTYTMTGKLPISESVQNNGSLYIHVYFVRNGFSPNPSDVDRYHSQHVVYKKRLLNKFKKRRFHTMKNLLTGTTDAHADLVRNATESKFEIISHWHPNLTLNLVNDQTGFVKGSIPPPLDEYVVFLPGDIYYYPILFFNDYWNLNSEYTPINSTTKVLNLTLTYYPLSLFKWQMYAAQGMQNKWFNMFGEDLVENNDEEQDSLKRAFIETNPYLLFITIVVSLVHSVFEFLAFKNDIQFWRNRKSLEGLSVRSVFFNVFQSVVVLLYVLDNETNFVIKVSVFVGLLIEIWKIQKVIDIQLDRENKLFDRIPMIKIKDKSTYTESQTKKYDLMAFRYLSWLLFPLLVCYAVYSVLYLEHKGWYSWVLSMLYGFLLTFGFIMMTPQLFINYKLKSVAHLPWRMLTYKALNTFIDDLFAFVIRMPMLYRLGCFRDDIIFCIYLYQRWIYRVDPKRINEFGTSAEMMEDETMQTPAITASATSSSTLSTSPDSVEEADKTIESQKPDKKVHNDTKTKSKAAKKID